MVHQLQYFSRFWRSLVIAVLVVTWGSSSLQASTETSGQRSAGSTYLGNAHYLFQKEQYFRSARYAFAAMEKDPALRPDAYSWVAIGLTRAHLYNAASYFFIKTLQSGNKDAIRRALTETQTLLLSVGPDLLRKYLIRHTSYEDYDSANRSAYLYALGKDALLAHEEDRAIGYLNGIQPSSPLWPFALQLKASAEAIHGDSGLAVQDFKNCVDHASLDDLKARCQAGIARSHYQADHFEAADQAYDRIPKTSLVWPDILFEQAWNAFARQEYNRTLGKLVSYKSPALSFVFNPEIDVLRAQSYLALCLYSDANDVINEFNGHYAQIGEQVKQFVEGKSKDLDAFFEVGKQALQSPIDSQTAFNPMLNRFVRGPYFISLLKAEKDIASEQEGVRHFGNAGASADPGRGFPGFLGQVLNWRKKSVRVLGGMFVKNSLIDYHSELISHFEKMSFIKLEMLKRAKDLLISKSSAQALDRNGRAWGNEKPQRKDYQYFWSFNGEFWNDELGDYVFGLESQCGARVGGGNG